MAALVNRKCRDRAGIALVPFVSLRALRPGRSGRSRRTGIPFRPLFALNPLRAGISRISFGPCGPITLPKSNTCAILRPSSSRYGIDQFPVLYRQGRGWLIIVVRQDQMPLRIDAQGKHAGA